MNRWNNDSTIDWTVTWVNAVYRQIGGKIEGQQTDKLYTSRVIFFMTDQNSRDTRGAKHTLHCCSSLRYGARSRFFFANALWVRLSFPTLTFFLSLATLVLWCTCVHFRALRTCVYECICHWLFFSRAFALWKGWFVDLTPSTKNTAVVGASWERPWPIDADSQCPDTEGSCTKFTRYLAILY